MKVLMVKVPECDFFERDKPVERQSHSAVVLPIGILQLGSYVKSKLPDVSVEYLDLLLEMNTINMKVDSGLSPFDYLETKIREEVDRAKADIIGLTCSANIYANMFHHCAAKLKEFAPNSILVVGGHYPSSYTERVANDANIDYVVVGEGEIPFVRLIDNYANGRLPDEKIIDTKEYLDDFVSFPPLDYEGIGLEKYLHLGLGLGIEKIKLVSFISSRGCPYQCIHCSTHNVWSRKFRGRSAEQMVDEMEYLNREYGVTNFVFVEDNFLIDKKRVKQFCELLIKKKLNIQWYPSSAHVNSLNEEIIHLMAMSGCQKIVIAIESGSPRVQKLIKKNVRLEHAVNVAESIRKEGLVCECLLMFGFPGETIEEMQETIRFARKLKCDWYQMGIATPLYKTKMYEICEKNNWLPEGDMKTSSFSEGLISTFDFSKEEVEELMWDANYQLNFLENKAYQDGDYDTAQKYFESVAKMYPDHFISKYMLFQIYKKEGWSEKTSDIALELKKIRDRDPDTVNGFIKKYNLDTDMQD